MATAAQIEANRANAQKSTGPRTPEGKTIVAQNAVKHGLRAQAVVSKGEDPGEFELYREEMLAELAPAGPVESLLAERIVGLSWRLRRAERLQGAAFDTLGEEKGKWIWSEEDKQYVLLQGTNPGPITPGSEEEALAADRKVVRDFGEGRILDRLLVYERRIEYSLYRTMAQLEKRQRLGRERGASSSECDASRESRRTWNSVDSEFPDGISGLAVPMAVAPAAGVGTNVPEAEGKSCGTNPICVTPCGTGILPVNEDHGQDAHATEPLASVTPGGMEVQGQMRQTKPICGTPGGTGILPVKEDHGRDAHATGTPDGVGTNVAEAEGKSCGTNPICGAPRGTGILPVKEDRGQDAHATGPLAGVIPGEMEVQGQMRQTKPICAGTDDRPVGYRPIFRRRG